MMNVGTRELKNRLSHYLRRVRDNGESLYVTDRGDVVAELRPVRSRARAGADRDALLALAAGGDLSMGSGTFDDFAPERPRRRGAVSKIVLAERR
jgi:prevent-host-death family protein